MWFDADPEQPEPIRADAAGDDILLGFFISWLIGLLAMLHWIYAP